MAKLVIGRAGPFTAIRTKGTAAVLYNSIRPAANQQELVVDLFDDSADTFFAPVVTATYTLTPALYADPDTFYAVTITVGTVNLSPSLFTDADTFYTATITSTYTLAPALFVDADTFYSATVISLAHVNPPLYSDPDTFYSATVAAGTVNLAPALFTDPDTFFAPAVGRGAVALNPNLYVDPDSFYGGTVANVPSGPVLLPSLFINASAFFGPVVSSVSYVYVRLLFPHVFGGVLIPANTIIGGADPVPQDFHYTPLMEGLNEISQNAIANLSAPTWDLQNWHPFTLGSM